MTGRPGPRALAAACAGLAAAAGLLWVGSATVWYRVSPVGGAPVELTGAQAAPWLGGTALLALAGVAGVVATGGVLRRVVGGLLALAGAAVLVAGVSAQLADPAALLPATGGSEVTAAPLLVVGGGLVLLVAGGLVLLRERALPRLGARYAPPGERRVERDPDRAAWQELDAGRDPTVDPPRDTGDDPGDGPRNTAV